MIKLHRVEPGSRFRVDDVDAGATPGCKGGKAKIGKVFKSLNLRLEELQNKLWAEHRRKVLVVLQGMDTSGKDGTISHVFEGVNPLGVKAVAWKAPSPVELDHDFLWRIHPHTPGRGEIVIFNRSHYEDVLAARVHALVPPKVWKARYDQINDFERLLAENDTSVLKFFLHIDADEQKRRLQERLADPAKRWKIRLADLEDRSRWKSYIEAYEAAITRTSTTWAPWFVVPANKKWYRNLVVATVLVQILEGLKLKRPEPADDISGVVIE